MKAFPRTHVAILTIGFAGSQSHLRRNYRYVQTELRHSAESYRRLHKVRTEGAIAPGESAKTISTRPRFLRPAAESTMQALLMCFCNAAMFCR